MNFSAEDRLQLDRCINKRYAHEKSVVLRYMNAIKFKAKANEDQKYKDLLRKTSISEGLRTFHLTSYRGVEVHILDETSLMHSKTLKSIDACISMAHCRLQGDNRVVLESGGNTGTAFTEYGQKSDVETFLFIPHDNLQLMNSRSFSSQKSHLISVENPGEVKKAAHLFSSISGFPHIPDIEWRYQASMLRGMFILEHMLTKDRFDWISQTISAAFGPIGIFRILGQFSKELGGLPSFLGIQQQANCPIYRAWKSRRSVIEPVETVSSEKLLTRVMYDSQPQTYGSFNEFIDLLGSVKGDLTTINHTEFDHLLKHDFHGKDILRLLKDNGIEIALRDGEVIEKTGLISLAGTLKEIDRGTIVSGSRVLCCLTSGMTEADGKAQPEFKIKDPDAMVGEYCKRVLGGDSHV
jgi:hypothetical protein